MRIDKTQREDLHSLPREQFGTQDEEHAFISHQRDDPSTDDAWTPSSYGQCIGNVQARLRLQTVMHDGLHLLSSRCTCLMPQQAPQRSK